MDVRMGFVDSLVYESPVYMEDYKISADTHGMDDNLWLYLSSLEDEGSIAPFSEEQNFSSGAGDARETYAPSLAPTTYASSSISSGTNSPQTPSLDGYSQSVFDTQRDAAYTSFSQQTLIPLISVTKTEKRMTRQAQNRASQRKFRARQVEKLKVLEEEVEDLKNRYAEARKSNDCLKEKCELLSKMVKEGVIVGGGFSGG